MAHDEELADRVRDVLSTVPDVAERRMFGGLAFLVGGAMAVAVSGNGGLMVRCDPAVADGLVERDGVARMVMQGRELAGWVLVDPAQLAEETVLQDYVAEGRRAARAAR
ncbi:TfoX N-terminal domain-containing protein [Klenkia soli]|uniref:TfoX N-terminal domain-containing protein n=1 Tax=Klenkia soli TaxID=1052260 RepID=A0A1H0PB70_9ACTN|nr:TfoX/Sxy family protein [Klenkia soli]SDP01908.1 TfoX N-terminal domain-containing protein [Klenkia soli]